MKRRGSSTASTTSISRCNFTAALEGVGGVSLPEQFLVTTLITLAVVVSLGAEFKIIE